MITNWFIFSNWIIIIYSSFLIGLACQKPNYEIGSASKLSFGKLSIDAAWKIDNTDEEIVNADDLLDETDKEKPDPLSLKGKREQYKYNNQI